MDRIIDWIKAIFYSREASNEIVSNNAKIVLYGLFLLIGLVILMYAITVVVAYNPKPDSVLIGPNATMLNDKIIKGIINDPNLTDEQKFAALQEHYKSVSDQSIDIFQGRFQQMEQLNAVYIAAISGAIALGGTLITQLWGRGHQ
jgi:hypothetical protein